MGDKAPKDGDPVECTYKHEEVEDRVWDADGEGIAEDGSGEQHQEDLGQANDGVQHAAHCGVSRGRMDGCLEVGAIDQRGRGGVELCLADVVVVTG